ncbi:MAG TPA: hypothetical protein VM347_33870 [Nonomuraea sp.]|nr:hypothetical protein [Nonomuraea sp.]
MKVEICVRQASKQVHGVTWAASPVPRLSTAGVSARFTDPAQYAPEQAITAPSPQPSRSTPPRIPFRSTS